MSIFYYFFPIIVNFWLSFDDFFYLVLIVLDDCVWELCWLSLIDYFWLLFLIEFWLSWMIVFESYVDCLWLITFDDCFLLSFDCPWWLSLRVMLNIDYFLWLFFIIIFLLFILNMYFCECKIVSFEAFWYHLILIYSNKR